jgi:hypothetical protein
MNILDKQKIRADHEKRKNYLKLDPRKNKNKVSESDFIAGNFEGEFK